MSKKGFTLIELVMVIVIIGILAAVAIPRFMSLRAEAERARCEADVGAIRTGLSGWYAKYWANGSRCPGLDYGGGAGDCNASGFPTGTVLSADTGSFAQFAFSEGAMPDFNHTDDGTTCTDWGDGTCYEQTTGVINMTELCGSAP